ncbi:MAG: hypothetical protein ACTSWX_05300 [Promethearchaeota archaeon]
MRISKDSNESPFKTSPRDMSVQLAQNLARKLGHPYVESVLYVLLEQ